MEGKAGRDLPNIQCSEGHDFALLLLDPPFVHASRGYADYSIHRSVTLPMALSYKYKLYKLCPARTNE